MTERDAAPSAGLTWYGSEEMHWPKGSPNLVPEYVPENPSPAWQELINLHNNGEWSEFERAQEGSSLRTEWWPVCVKLTYYHDRISVTLADANEEYCDQERHFTREDDAMNLYHATAEQIAWFGERLAALGWKPDSDD